MVIVGELVLAFYGPMVFVRKPSLVVGTPFAYGLEHEQIQQALEHLQRSFARSGAFKIVSHTLIEDYFLEQRDDPEFTMERRLNYTEYIELATDLEIEKLVICTMYTNGDHFAVILVIRHVETREITHRFEYEASDFDGFLTGEGADGERFDLVDDLRVETKGVNLSDNLFFVLLCGQLVVALGLILRRKRDFVDLANQIVLVAVVLLFLFALIYAQNASMDYVQRFIANKGQISLAEDTASEQLYAAIRYGPMLIINLGIFVGPRVRRRSDANVASPAATIGTVSRTWAPLLALCSALLYAVSFPSFLSVGGYGFLAWVSLVPLFLALLFSTLPRAVLYFMAYGALQTLLLNYWHGTYSYISLAFSVIISTVLFSAVMVPFVLVVRKSGKWGFLALAAFWVTFEYARTLGYTGYPWGLLGVSQYAFLPVIQIADLTGVWGVSFLVALTNAAIAWVLAAKDNGWKWGKTRWTPAAVAGGLLAASLLYAGVRAIPSDAGEEEKMRVVITQSNTDPRKHDYELNFDTLTALTTAAIAESGRLPDLIVWPEGGLKTDLRYWSERTGTVARGAKLRINFLEFLKGIDTWVVCGTQDHAYLTGEDGNEEKRNFNSSVLMNPAGEIDSFYHKIHLVPFTESFPFKDRYPQLAQLLDKFDTSNWLEGDERHVYDHPTARFFTPICFEDIFPNDVRQFVLQDVDLIANMSNDYWSLTPVEGKQHAIHALFRAVENRRPMVRSTTSGLSTYVTVNGRLSDDSPEYYTADYMIVDVPIRERGFTIYTRFGDWFPRLCLILTAATALFLVGRSIYNAIRRPAARPRSPE